MENEQTLTIIDMEFDNDFLARPDIPLHDKNIINNMKICLAIGGLAPKVMELVRSFIGNK